MTRLSVTTRASIAYSPCRFMSVSKHSVTFSPSLTNSFRRWRIHDGDVAVFQIMAFFLPMAFSRVFGRLPLHGSYE